MNDVKTILLLAIVVGLTWYGSKEHYHEQGFNEGIEATITEAAKVIEAASEQSKEAGRQEGFEEGFGLGQTFLEKVCSTGQGFAITEDGEFFYCVPVTFFEQLSTTSQLPQTIRTNY